MTRIPAQHAALRAELAAGDYDAVLAETGFLGAVPLALAPRAGRLPVVGVSTTPLSLVSDDCPHFGSGLPVGDPDSPRIRRRNARTAWLLRAGPLRPVQEAFVAALLACGVPPEIARGLDYFDHAAAPDTTFHLGEPALEYPRHDAPASVRCAGPLRE